MDKTYHDMHSYGLLCICGEWIMCAEALSALLCHAESSGCITGIPTSKRGLRLSHLFFADDSLLYCKANSVEWRRLMRLLEKYENASG